MQHHPVTIKLFAFALLCASGAGCVPDALGPRSSPAALRWGFAGANHNVRMEYDGATMVAEGSVVRVWIRMINLRDVTPAKPNPDPFPPIPGRIRLRAGRAAFAGHGAPG
jgi:hypothetical protein